MNEASKAILNCHAGQKSYLFGAVLTHQLRALVYGISIFQVSEVDSFA